MDQEKFINARAAAQYLGISDTFICKLAREGKIPAHPLPIGNNGLRRTWRFRLSELNSFMSGAKQ